MNLVLANVEQMWKIPGAPNSEGRERETRDKIYDQIRMCLSQLSPLVAKLGAEIVLESTDLASWQSYLGPCYQCFDSLLRAGKALGVKQAPNKALERFFEVFARAVKHGVRVLKECEFGVYFVACFSAVAATSFQCQSGEPVSITTTGLGVLLKELRERVGGKMDENADQVLVARTELEGVKGVPTVAAMVPCVDELIAELQGLRTKGVDDALAQVNKVRSKIIAVITKDNSGVCSTVLKTLAKLERALQDLHCLRKLHNDLSILLDVLGSESIAIDAGAQVLSVSQEIYLQQQEIELKVLGLSEEVLKLVHSGNTGELTKIMDGSVTARLGEMFPHESFVSLPSSTYGNCVQHLVGFLSGGSPDSDLGAAIAKNLIVAKITEVSVPQKETKDESAGDELTVTMKNMVLKLHQCLSLDHLSPDQHLVVRILAHAFNIVVFSLSQITDPASRDSILDVLAKELPPAKWLASVLNVGISIERFQNRAEKLIKEPETVNTSISAMLHQPETMAQKQIDEALAEVMVSGDHLSLFLDDTYHLVSSLQFVTKYGQMLEMIKHTGSSFVCESMEIITPNRLESSLALMSCLRCHQLSFKVRDASFYVKWLSFVLATLRGSDDCSFVDEIPFCDFSGILKDACRELHYLKVRIYSKVRELQVGDDRGEELIKTFEEARTMLIVSFPNESLSTELGDKLDRMLAKATEISPALGAEVNQSIPAILTFSRLLMALINLGVSLAECSKHEYSLAGTFCASVVSAMKRYLVEFGDCPSLVEMIDQILERGSKLFDNGLCQQLSPAMERIEEYLATLTWGNMNESIPVFIAAVTKEAAGEPSKEIPEKLRHALLKIGNLVSPMPELQTVYERFSATVETLDYAAPFAQPDMDSLFGSWRNDRDRYLFKFLVVDTRYFMRIWAPDAKISVKVGDTPELDSVGTESFAKLTRELPKSVTMIRGLMKHVEAMELDKSHPVNSLMQELVAEVNKSLTPLQCNEEQQAALDVEYDRLMKKVNELRAAQVQQDGGMSDQVSAMDKAHRQIQQLSTELFKHLLQDSILRVRREATDKEIADIEAECDQLQRSLDESVCSEAREHEAVGERLEVWLKEFDKSREVSTADVETISDLETQLAQLTEENQILHREVTRLSAGKHRQEDEVRLLKLRSRVFPRRKPVRPSDPREDQVIRGQIAEVQKSIDRLHRRLQPTKTDEQRLEEFNEMRMAAIFSGNFDVNQARYFVTATLERVRDLTAQRRAARALQTMQGRNNQVVCYK